MIPARETDCVNGQRSDSGPLLIRVKHMRPGEAVTAWSIREEGIGYHTPVGVAVSKDGTMVYVTDIDNRRVLVLAVEQ